MRTGHVMEAALASFVIDSLWSVRRVIDPDRSRRAYPGQAPNAHSGRRSTIGYRSSPRAGGPFAACGAARSPRRRILRSPPRNGDAYGQRVTQLWVDPCSPNAESQTDRSLMPTESSPSKSARPRGLVAPKSPSHTERSLIPTPELPSRSSAAAVGVARSVPFAKTLAPCSGAWTPPAPLEPPRTMNETAPETSVNLRAVLAAQFTVAAGVGWMGADRDARTAGEVDDDGGAIQWIVPLVSHVERERADPVRHSGSEPDQRDPGRTVTGGHRG